MFFDISTRPQVSEMAYVFPMDRSEAELAINIKKATNTDETAPKRKHVRACIVYTWDHKSSQSFWAGMKVYVLQIPSIFLPSIGKLLLM